MGKFQTLTPLICALGRCFCDALYTFLHKFRAWKGKNLFADGVVRPNGSLDVQRLLNQGSLSIDKFKDLMVAAYVNCVEVTGHPLEPSAKYVSATYKEYIKIDEPMTKQEILYHIQ